MFSDCLTQSPKVAELQKLFGERHQVKHTLAVSNYKTALHLVLLAVGFKPGDEVIVPAFTWVSTANAVVYSNATPIFVDVDPVTFNIDIEKLKEQGFLIRIGHEKGGFWKIIKEK